MPAVKAQPKTSGSHTPATVCITTATGMQQGVLAIDLMTGLRGMVPTLGGKKVTVGFAGQDAFCDATLSYVNIPALPPTAVIPLDVAREIRGFAAHEAAHIAFTDPEVFPSAIVNDKGEFDKLLKEIWNCVEDFMIEKHWLALYPGAKKNFAATEARCCKGYLEMVAQNPDCAKDLRSTGPVALTWMRSIFFGLGIAASRECLKTMPQSLQVRVMGWFDDILEVETTQDCLEAARRIWKDILKDPFDPKNPPKDTSGQGARPQGRGMPQPGTPDQTQNSPSHEGQGHEGQSQPGQGQPGQGQSGQDKPGQGQPGDDQTSQGAAQHGKNDIGQGQPGPSAQTPCDGNAPSKAGKPAPSNEIRGGAEGAPIEFPGNAGPDPIATSANIMTVMKQVHAAEDDVTWVSAEVVSTAKTGPASGRLGDPGGLQTSEQIISSLRGEAGATSTQLRRALKAISKSRMKGGRFDGILDSRRAANLATGNTEIFRRKVKGEKIDTAVSILVDCSSSMSSTIRICQELALILETAFTGTPIKHEIIGYTTADIKHADPSFQTMIKAHANRGDDIKTRAVGLYEFRSFTASHAAALQSIGNMHAIPMGMTPTSDAILMTHDRLARRPETRHVMFVLTDGAADSQKRCAHAVQAVERCGVTVVGIGIGTTAVEHAFDNHVSLASATDLPALMMSNLTAMLLGEKHKVGMKGRKKELARAG